MKPSDGDVTNTPSRPRSLMGTTDIGFGNQWQLSWKEWNPPGLIRTFVTDGKFVLPSSTFNAFGYEIGEAPEDLPCGLIATGRARVLLVSNIVAGTPQPIMDNIYRIHFVLPEGAAPNAYNTISVCLSLNSIEGSPESLQTTSAFFQAH